MTRALPEDRAERADISRFLPIGDRGRDAVRTLQATLAVKEAAATGRLVQLL